MPTSLYNAFIHPQRVVIFTSVPGFVDPLGHYTCSTSLPILQFLVPISILVIVNLYDIHGERSRHNAGHIMIIARHRPLIEVIIVVSHCGRFILVQMVAELRNTSSREDTKDIALMFGELCLKC
jgi:hypothetical protein